MRSLLLIPASIFLTAAGGFAICVGLGRNTHALEMTWAAGAIAAACFGALLPIWFTRHGDQLAVSQASLAGSMIHLFVAILPVGVCIAGGIPLHAAFIAWLLPLYWMTLIALVVVFARAIRTARPATPSHKA
jgi:hypothetical protein